MPGNVSQQTGSLRRKSFAGYRPFMPYVGDLIHTTVGTWITRPPARCPNGHPVGPNAVLVGHRACVGHGGGHTTWNRRTCDQIVHGPPLNTHCTALDGPAAVRISNRRS